MKDMYFDLEIQGELSGVGDTCDKFCRMFKRGEGDGWRGESGREEKGEEQNNRNKS